MKRFTFVVTVTVASICATAPPSYAQSAGRAFDIAVSRGFCGDSAVKSAKFKPGDPSRVAVECGDPACYASKTLTVRGATPKNAYRSAVAADACNGGPVRYAKVVRRNRVEVRCGNVNPCGVVAIGATRFGSNTGGGGSGLSGGGLGGAGGGGAALSGGVGLGGIAAAGGLSLMGLLARGASESGGGAGATSDTKSP